MIAILAGKYQNAQKLSENEAQEEMMKNVNRHKEEKAAAEAKQMMQAQQVWTHLQEKHLADLDKRHPSTLRSTLLGENRSTRKATKVTKAAAVWKHETDMDAANAATQAKVMLKQFKARQLSDAAKVKQPRKSMATIFGRSASAVAAPAANVEDKLRTEIVKSPEYQLQAQMATAVSQHAQTKVATSASLQPSRAQNMQDVFDDHPDLHETDNALKTNKAVEEQNKAQTSQAVKFQKQATKEELKRLALSKEKDLTDKTDLGESNVVSLFHTKQTAKKSSLPATDAKAVKLAKQQLKQEKAVTSKREKTKRAHAAFGLHGKKLASLFHAKQKKVKSTLPAADATAVKLAKQQLNVVKHIKVSKKPTTKAGERNISTLFHKKNKKVPKSPFSAMDATAVKQAKQQLKQQKAINTLRAKKKGTLHHEQVGNDIKSLFGVQKKKKTVKIALPTADAEAVKMAKAQLKEATMTNKLHQRIEEAVEVGQQKDEDSKSITSLFHNGNAPVNDSPALSAEETQEIAAQRAMTASTKKENKVAEEHATKSMQALFGQGQKKTTTQKEALDGETAAALDAQKSMVETLNAETKMAKEMKQRTEAAVQVDGGKSITSLFGASSKKPSPKGNADNNAAEQLTAEERREVEAQHAMMQATKKENLVAKKFKAAKKSIQTLFGGSETKSKKQKPIIDKESAAALKAQKAMVAQLEMQTEMNERNEAAVQVDASKGMQSLFAGHAAKKPDINAKDNNGLPVWMSSEDKAQILAAKRMQQSLLSHMQQRQQSVLQENATPHQKSSSEDDLRAMFGQGPRQHMAEVKAPISHVKAVAEFDAAVQHAEAPSTKHDKAVWVLGESENKPEARKTPAKENLANPKKGRSAKVKKKVKKAVDKQALKQEFQAFVAERTVEFNQLATVMKRKDLFDSMQHKFNKFLARLGDSKGEPQSDTDGGDETTSATKSQRKSTKTKSKSKKHGPPKKQEKAAKKVPSGMNVPMAHRAPGQTGKHKSLMSSKLKVKDPIGEKVSQSITDKSLGNIAFDFNQEDTSYANRELEGMSKLDKEKLMVNRLTRLFNAAKSH